MVRLLILLIAISLLTACTQTKSGDVLFLDDFSNAESGFHHQADADAITEYTDGQYKIQVSTPQLNVWSAAGPQFTDAVIEVNANTAAGTENNLYGLMCRYRDDKNFYFFVVSADGYYAIGKVKENDSQAGEIVLLSSQVYEPSDKILTGQAVNHVEAACVGQMLTLTVNGSPLSQVTDSEFSDGQVGLIVGTFDEPDTEVHFDDLVVTQP